MKKMVYSFLLMVLLPLPGYAQSQAGQVWYESAFTEAVVGHPFIVHVHLQTGTVQPNTLEFRLSFDPAVLGLAFSQLPTLENPDLALGSTLVNAGITDLQAVHLDSEPGVLVLSRVGAKAGEGPWPVSGDIDLLEITFHPTIAADTTVLAGTVLYLLDGSDNQIGEPQVISKNIQVIPAAVPATNPLNTMLLMIMFLITGLFLLYHRTIYIF